MTLFRMILRELLCDYPKCSMDFGNGGDDRLGPELRRDAKAAGWTRRDGKDYCPEHSHA